MIALALACRPSLVIADEPTTALDVVMQAQVLQLLERLREELGLALILISHDLGVLAETCDRIAVMYAGRVVETGPVVTVFSKPQHPYTKRLLETLPVIGGQRDLAAPIPAARPIPVIRRMAAGSTRDVRTRRIAAVRTIRRSATSFRLSPRPVISHPGPTGLPSSRRPRWAQADERGTDGGS